MATNFTQQIVDTVFNMSSSIMEFSGFSNQSNDEDTSLLEFPDYVDVQQNGGSITLVIKNTDRMTSLNNEIQKDHQQYMSTRQHGDIYKIPNPDANFITCTIYQTTNTIHIQGYGYLYWTYKHFIKILHRIDEGTNIISSQTSMKRLALNEVEIYENRIEKNALSLLTSTPYNSSTALKTVFVPNENREDSVLVCENDGLHLTLQNDQAKLKMQRTRKQLT